MREIRFRAWCKLDKRMYNVSELDINDDSIDVLVNLNKRGEDLKEKKLHWSFYELMQYTGIKDKNGIKVYEGDIVIAKACCNDEFNRLATAKEYRISFLRGTFIFEDEKGMEVEQLDDGSYEWFSIENVDKKKLEVIGNIYDYRIFDGEKYIS